MCKIEENRNIDENLDLRRLTDWVSVLWMSEN
jgi:hypothetical protein